MLELYGHPFSSYTWKAQIALHAIGAEYTSRMLDEDHPENGAFVQQHGGPFGKFPVLVDDGRVIFESTSIIEWLQLHHAGSHRLIPADADAALQTRTYDRVFDNYVMNVMQGAVDEYLRNPDQPDMVRVEEVRASLRKVYRWLEHWLGTYEPVGHDVTLVECAAAPALFYADWVERIPEDCPLLIDWRTHVLALEPVSRCVEAARPYRHYFPLGAPDRD